MERGKHSCLPGDAVMMFGKNILVTVFSLLQLPKLRCGAGDHAPLIEIALGDLWIGIGLRGKVRLVAID